MDLTMSVLLDESIEFTMEELCQTCGISADFINELVAFGIIDPIEISAPWHFHGIAIKRIQVVQRLQRDLQINLAGSALVLDLLDELAELRQWIRK